MPRILLINPPVYDLRLDWARWHQPCGLLQLGHLLRAQGNDVRLIDCLQPQNGGRIQRKRHDTIMTGPHEFPRWQFGLSWDQIDKIIERQRDENWYPHAIYVTCLMTFWWEGARDLIRLLRKWFPKTHIALGGTYPFYAPQHAKKHIKGVHFDPEIGSKAKNYATDFRLYGNRPPFFAGLFLYRSSPERIVGEIETKLRYGVREFAFFDEAIPGKNPKHFERVLNLIIQKGLNIKLKALGNLSPRALTKTLVKKMRDAGYRQIFLHDDIALGSALNGDLSAYEHGIQLLLEHGGYHPRTDEITAMVLVGVPGEDIEHVVERLTRTASVVGSVNLVPYQPTPGTETYARHLSYLNEIPLELQNAKLFPFAKLNNVDFSEYQELIRLGALLNSKYRSTTFNFLGDNEIATMARKSIADEAWRPKPIVRIPLISQ